MKSLLYSQVVGVSERYLGPAADRFMRRQIDFHLRKTPENLNEGDISKLAESIRVSLGLLTQDKVMVNNAVREIKAIVAKAPEA